MLLKKPLKVLKEKKRSDCVLVGRRASGARGAGGRGRRGRKGGGGGMERQGIQGDAQINTQRFTCWRMPRGLKMHGRPSEAQRYN